MTWLEYADHDWETARTMSAGTRPPYEIVAFHYQQCAEKCLKAALVALEEPVPKTHDLDYIADLLEPHFPQVVDIKADCDRLTAYAAASRYPGESAPIGEAIVHRAAESCERIRLLMHSILAPYLSGNS